MTQRVYARPGFATLLSVLIVGAIGAGIAISLIAMAVSATQTSAAIERAAQARALANACAEEALQQINDSIPFSGTDTLTLGQGSCTYEVVNTGGQNRQITISAHVGTAVRTSEIIIDMIAPDINIVSWQEFSDF